MITLNDKDGNPGEPGKIDKAHVKRAFSKAAATYNTSSSLQSEVSNELCASLPRDFQPTDALDIGCGTGRVLEGLRALYPDARLTGVDIAQKMLDETKQRFGGGASPELFLSDMEALPFADSSFDLIVSSLAYQWAVDIQEAFGEAFRVMSPGALFAFSTFSAGTLGELAMSLNGAAGEMMTFLSEGEIGAALKGAGFKSVELRRAEMKCAYADLFSLLRSLKAIGAASPSVGADRTLAKGAGLKKAVGVYRERFPAPAGSSEGRSWIEATYNIVYALAVKPR